MQRNDKEWQDWMGRAEPENAEIPVDF